MSTKRPKAELDIAAREVAGSVSRLIAQGADIVEAYLGMRADVLNESDAVRRRILERHEKAMRKHTKAVKDARERMITLAFVSAGLGIGGVAALIFGGLQGPGPGLLIGALVTGLISLRARVFLRTAEAPAAPELPPPAPPRLDPADIGYADSERFAKVRAQVLDVVPAIRMLHADAANELAAADAEAAPALIGMVHRLALLARIRREMGQTHAAVAAEAAARDVQTRLADGVDTYERLLAAAATMLAAPDMGRSSVAALTPAIDALTAYAHGLSMSAGTSDQPTL